MILTNECKTRRTTCRLQMCVQITFIIWPIPIYMYCKYLCCNIHVLLLQTNGRRRSSRSNRGKNVWRDNFDCTPSPVQHLSRKKKTRRKIMTTSIQHRLDRNTDILNVNMCTCGLMSSRVATVVTSHKYHDKNCNKFDDSAPPPSNHQLLDIDKVLSTHINEKVLTKTAARKHEWGPIMESAYTWLRTWLAHKEGNSWPTNDYPWLQWAIHFHSKSEYLFCKNSTAKTVAKKAKEWTTICSTQCKGFKLRREMWWKAMRDKVIGLSNRQFRASTRNEHVLM